MKSAERSGIQVIARAAAILRSLELEPDGLSRRVGAGQLEPDGWSRMVGGGWLESDDWSRIVGAG